MGFLVQVVQTEPSAVVWAQLQAALSELLSPYGQRMHRRPDTGGFEVVPRA